MRGAYSLFMTKTTKTERAPKGMPTDLNLSTLDGVLNGERIRGTRTMEFRDGDAGHTEAPNRLCPTDVAAMRRCMKFGLVEVVGRTTLRLTEMGESALCAYAFEYGQRMAAREVLS